MQQSAWSKKFSGKRVWLIVAGLVILFFSDDFLMVLLVEKLQIIHVNKWFYRSAMIWFFILSVGLAFAVFLIMRKRPTTGREGLFGVKGRVIGFRDGVWQVKVRSEIWNAESEKQLQIGDKIVVTDIRGLMLVVKPIKPELRGR